MKKIIIIVCILLTVSFAFAAADYTIRFNTVAAPTQPQVLAMEKFKEVLENLSGGKIAVKIFHSGQLGDQQTSLLAVMRGDLEMAGDGAPSWFADLGGMPKMGVLNSAYVFRDLDHMYTVMNSPFVQEWFEELAKTTGMRVLDTWYLGTRELNTTAKTGIIKKPEDLKGVKIRMPNNEAFLDMGRAIGANPTPMGFGEVYLALRTGTIDGQDNPLPTDLAAKFVEVTKYIVLTDHSIGMINPVISEKFWSKLSVEYKTYIKKALLVARYYMNDMVLEQEVNLLKQFMDEYGMEVIIPDQKAFMDFAKNYYSKEEFNKKWGQGLYEFIQNYPQE